LIFEKPIDGVCRDGVTTGKFILPVPADFKLFATTSAVSPYQPHNQGIDSYR
jgi:hypothetical protein